MPSWPADPPGSFRTTVGLSMACGLITRRRPGKTGHVDVAVGPAGGGGQAAERSLLPEVGAEVELDGLDAAAVGFGEDLVDAIVGHVAGVGEEEDDLGLQPERRTQGHHVLGIALGCDTLKLALHLHLVGRRGRHQSLLSAGVGEDPGPLIVEDYREPCVWGKLIQAGQELTLGHLQRVPLLHTAGAVDDVSERLPVLAGAEELGSGADAAAEPSARTATPTAAAAQAEAGNQAHAGGLRSGQGTLQRLGRLLRRAWQNLVQQGIRRRVQTRPLGIGTGCRRYKGNAAQPSYLPWRSPTAAGYLALVRPVIDRFEFAPQRPGSFRHTRERCIQDRERRHRDQQHVHERRAPQRAGIGKRRLTKVKLLKQRAAVGLAGFGTLPLRPGIDRCPGPVGLEGEAQTFNGISRREGLFHSRAPIRGTPAAGRPRPSLDPWVAFRAVWPPRAGECAARPAPQPRPGPGRFPASRPPVTTTRTAGPPGVPIPVPVPDWRRGPERQRQRARSPAGPRPRSKVAGPRRSRGPAAAGRFRHSESFSRTCR